MKRVKSFTAQALKGLLQPPSRMRHDRLVAAPDDGWMEVMLEGRLHERAPASPSLMNDVPLLRMAPLASKILPCTPLMLQIVDERTVRQHE